MRATARRDRSAPAGAARRWLQPDSGRGTGSDAAFFAAREDLVLVARRAMRALGGGFVRYLDVAEGGVYRVTVDVSNAERRVARLDVLEAESPFGLTVRELQVATCVAGGLGNRSIAAALGCSRRTVATHLEHVYAKTGASSRAVVATLVAEQEAYVAPLPSEHLVLPKPLLAVLRGPVAPRRTAVRFPRPRPALLGAVYPADASVGADVVAMRCGGQLAVQELNGGGGVAGRPVEHVTVTATPEGLQDALTALAARGADALLLGNFPLPFARPAIADAAAAGAPVLHSMTGQALSEDVYAAPTELGAVFQVCSTESAYVPGLLRALRPFEGTRPYRARRRRLAVLLRESTFESGAAEQVQRQAEEAGWDLVFLQQIADRTDDFGDVIRRLELVEPDVISLSIFPESTLQAFLSAAGALRERTQIHAAWSPATPDFITRCGELSEGLLWSTVIGNVDSPGCAGFERRYRAAFRSEPGLGAAAVHYDAVNVLAQAWSRVSRPWDFAAVREQLRSVAWFGVTGAHQFLGQSQRGLAYPDDTPDPTLGHPHLVYRIAGGAHQRLAPPLLR